MKKKIATILAAAVMAVAAAAPAMAAFGDNMDLIRIVYNAAGTQEVISDLGNINSILANPGSLSTSSFITGQTGSAGSGTLDAGTLFGNTSLSNLYVAYIVFDVFNTNKTYLSGLTAPDAVDNGNWVNAIGNLQAYIKSLTPANGTAVGSSTNPNSYASIFQGAGAGSLGGLVDPNTNSIEMNLASLASGGSVTQKLYYFADNSGGTAALTPLTLTTGSNGVSAAASAVPIPPSFILMGSGLLGMVGIRRRFAA